MNTRHLVSSLTLALVATLGAAAPAMAAVRCVDFLGFADNQPLPEKFKLANFGFQDRSGGFAPFVNVFTDLIGQPVHGMQFDDRGMRLRPPGPSLSVELRVGSFVAPRPLRIRALDAAGGVQDLVILPGDSIMHSVLLMASTAPITEVRIVGGGDEGVINQACATR